MKKEEIKEFVQFQKEKAKIYGELADVGVTIGLGHVAADDRLRHMAILGAVGTMATGTALVLGSTAVITKALFVGSLGLMVGSFVKGLRQGLKAQEAVKNNG